MMETSYTVNNRPPVKEIALAISLLVFGTFGIVFGVIMAVNRIGGDTAHGQFLFPILPSFYSFSVFPFPFSNCLCSSLFFCFWMVGL